MPTQVVNPSHGKVMDALNRHTWDFCVWTRERKRLSSSTISSAMESQPLLPGEDEVGSEESDTLPGSVTTRGKLCESDRRTSTTSVTRIARTETDVPTSGTSSTPYSIFPRVGSSSSLSRAT